VPRIPRLSAALALAAPALLASACSDYVSTAGPEHCGTVGTEVWGRDMNPHDITCDVVVSGDLVIGPGVRLRFEPGVSMTVQGTLRVEGTAERPVRFEPAEPDRAWGGIVVRDWEPAPSPTSSSTVVPARMPRGDVAIHHAILTDGGLMADSRGAITIERGAVHLSDVEIVRSRQCGVHLGERGRLTEDSGSISVRASSVAGVCAHPAAVGSLPAALDLEANDFIEVSAGRLQGSHTWVDLGYQLRPTGDIQVFRGDLHLGPGVDLAFAPQALLRVGGDEPGPLFGQEPVRGDGGPWRREQASRLFAKGTVAAPVRLGSARADGVQGAWGGVWFSGSTGDAGGLLEHVAIEGAGAAVTSEPASLALTGGAALEVQDVAIRDGYGAGLLLDGARLASASRGLRISGNAYPAVVSPDAVTSLPATDSVYTGNDVKEQASAGTRATGDVIYVRAGRVRASGVIRRLGVPYNVDGVVTVGDTADNPIVVEIEPGVELRFPAAAGLVFGAEAPVALSIGSALGPPVQMVPAPRAAGPWRGLWVGPGVEGELHQLQVVGAGAVGWGVRIDATDLSVRGLTIAGHTASGLRLTGSFAADSRDLVIRDGVGAIHAELGSVPSIPATGLQLAANDEPWILLSGARVSRSAIWAALSVPYRIDQAVAVDGVLAADGAPEPARLTLQPGVQILFGRAGALRTERFGNGTDRGHGTLRALGTAGSPIVLRAVDPAVGFAGLTFRDEDFAFPDTGIAFPIAERSALRDVVVDGGGAMSSLAAVTFDASTLPVERVAVRNSPNFGVGLINAAFSEPATPPSACDVFDRSVFTFSGNAGNGAYQGQLGPGDFDVVDRRTNLIACD
jgi:hypothetical protein